MKYLFFDIDGTLVGHDKAVTKKNREAIIKAREKGHKVFVCTGRAPTSITPNILDIGFDGVISSAGAFVEVGGEYIFENYISQNLLSQVLLLFTNKKVLLSLETKDALYQSPGIMDFFIKMMTKKHSGDNFELARLLEERSKSEIRLPIREFDISTTKVTKLCFLSEDKIAFYDCVKYLAKEFNVVIFSNPEDDYINGEIILKDCTKSEGMSRILDHIGGDINETIAYGDSMNDFEMIRDANMGVVSVAGAQKLKDIADDFFEDPDKDGIYKHLVKINIIEEGN